MTPTTTQSFYNSATRKTIAFVEEATLSGFNGAQLQEVFELDTPIFDIMKNATPKNGERLELMYLCEENAENAFMDAIHQKMLQDLAYGERLLKRFRAIMKKWRSVALEHEKRFDAADKYTNEELAEEFTALFDFLKEFFSVFYAAYYLPPELSGLLEGKVKKEDLLMLISYAIPSLVVREEKEYLTILKKVQKQLSQSKTSDDVLKSVEIQELLNQHVKKWGHLHMEEITGEPYSVEDYEGFIKKEIELNVSKELDRLSSVNEESIFKKLLKKYPKKDTEQIIQLARESYMHRHNTIEDLGRYFRSFIPMLTTIADRLGVTYENFAILSKKEIIDGLSGELSASAIQDIVEEREEKGLTIYSRKGQVYFETGADYKNLKEADLENSKKTIDSLKGMITFKGRMHGRVRVVLDPQREEKDFKKGEILVTAMTTPNFVNMMQIAGGVITDEGGMLCHAAIISREFKIPCIVGTKFATKALETGDSIDANMRTGKVRIMSSR